MQNKLRMITTINKIARIPTLQKHITSNGGEAHEDKKWNFIRYFFIMLNVFSGLCFFTEMEFCETPHNLCSGYQTDVHSVSRRGYQLEMGSDVDTETEGAASPDHALRMWIRGMKSEHSSCLSSRANSALSLTDTDHERKSDGDNGNGTSYTVSMPILAF